MKTTFPKWLLPLCGVLAAFALLPRASVAEPGDFEILRSFPAPMMSPDGLEWVNGNLWTTECTSEEIFEVEPEWGTVLQNFVLPDAFIDHLAWDGEFLWGNDHHGKYRIHRVDVESGTVNGGFDVDFRPMGLAWDGTHLWSMEVDSRAIYRIAPETGEIVRILSAPGGNVCGIGWDGVCLWVSDLTDGKYYQIDPETGEVALTLDPPGGLGKLFTGFAWDGQYAWVDDEDPQNPTIFQLDIEMNTTGPCAHPVGQGQECGPSGPFCAGEYACVDAGDGASICATLCDSATGGACPGGLVCQPRDNGSDVCVSPQWGDPSAVEPGVDDVGAAGGGGQRDGGEAGGCSVADAGSLGLPASFLLLGLVVFRRRSSRTRHQPRKILAESPQASVDRQ